MNLQEITERKTEIRSEIDANPELSVERIDELTAETEKLNDEERTLLVEAEKREALIKATLSGKGEVVAERSDERKDIKMEISSQEYRNLWLKKVQGVQLNDEEKRAFDTTGGYIPTETARVFFDKMVKVAPMLDEITLLRVAGNVKFVTEGTRNAAAKHTEGGAVTPAADTTLSVELGAYEYIKIVSISESAATMAIPEFEGWLAQMIAEDIAVAVEDAIINGDGSGDPKGVEYARTWTAGTSAIAYTKGGLPTYDNVVDLAALLPARYQGNGKLLCNSAFLFGYLAKIKDDNKQPILVKDFANGVPYRVLGFPVIISDKVANGVAYLGDFKKVVGNLPMMKVDSDINFRSASIDYRGLATFDCDIALADAFVKLVESAS